MPLTREQWSSLKHRAEAGDPQAQWQVGAWLEDGVADPNGVRFVRRDDRAAVRWLRRSAAGGSAAGQNHFGVCLSGGRGVRRNDAEALRWFKSALRKGDSCAAANIAAVYEGRGDHDRAMIWYRRAAHEGDQDASMEAGRGYYSRDPERAVRYLRKAIRSRNISQWGREEAMIQLGRAYHDGRGVRRSDVFAMRWLSRANRDNDHDDVRELVRKITRKTR